jgi:hypothetical protein
VGKKMSKQINQICPILEKNNDVIKTNITIEYILGSSDDASLVCSRTLKIEVSTSDTYAEIMSAAETAINTAEGI